MIFKRIPLMVPKEIVHIQVDPEEKEYEKKLLEKNKLIGQNGVNTNDQQKQIFLMPVVKQYIFLQFSTLAKIYNQNVPNVQET
ncbi:UNKNOWN [Stylonychia lemnae]|uniref:Uncharacterized protein n=1 Tax=Stylonychia lemnae TaxID=5949 RepID=A0A078A3T2_STYLE|nr:UNKNOWN [Stylonychia lemnae]|eukprot:CDW76913.1 UNKNOWN [Stylonychia lemnae]